VALARGGVTDAVGVVPGVIHAEQMREYSLLQRPSSVSS